MLSEVLGIVIAFITIVLLLSILVTSLVQMSQALLRLRARNLKTGLAALILKARERPTEKPTRRNKKAAREDAAKILNADNIALINRVAKPTSLFRGLFGPKVSWVEVKELPDAIKEEVSDLNEDKRNQIQQDFERVQRPLQGRFLKTMRLWTIAWALFIAAIFQVSTPALLSDLAKDTERRERILAGLDEELAHAGETLAQVNHEDASEEALQVLQSRYPELRQRIGQASGVGVSKDVMVEELALVLEGVSQRAEILEQYEELLEWLAEEQLGQARFQAERSMQRLAHYEVQVWPDDWSFYFAEGEVQLDAILGVLITAILLSLGAPFWFEQLRNVARLRDVLAGPPPAQAGSGGQSNSATAGAQNSPPAGTPGGQP
ncbi:MAG: hypothetical protein ACYTFA_07365 [Planctomycetota bacterium]|jgi:hypothetical protein